MRIDEVDLVNRYLDGELDQHELTVFEERLLSDADLRAYVDEIRALCASAAALEVLQAPETSLPGGIRWSHGNVGSRVRPYITSAIAAAACVLIGIAIGIKVVKPPMAGVTTEAFRIVYYAPDAGSVAVLGDFNGWTGEIPLSPKGEEGYWLAELHVRPGEYRYILIVDGEERPGDPLADYVIDDDFGSKNSVVRIGL